jgi:hypothetical protein
MVFDSKKRMRNMGLMFRAPWHVNRSPLRYAVKTAVSAWNLNEKLERRRQAQLLDVSEREKASAEGLNGDGYSVVTELMDASVQQQFPGGKRRPFFPTLALPLQKLVLGL